MPRYPLVLDKDRSAGTWLVMWDDAMLSISDPAGKTVLEIPAAKVHRLVDQYDMEIGGKLSVSATDVGSLHFKKNKEVARALRPLVLHGIAGDAEYRESQRRAARFAIRGGSAMFIVCGGLFALYCWWAFIAGDPPKESWLYKVLLYGGWLIHLILLVLLGAALAGPCAIFRGVIQLRRVRRAERL